MRLHLLFTIFSWAVLQCAPGAEAQTPVEVSFQTDPVQVQTGTDILFTVVTISDVFTVTWQYQGGVTLGLWVNGAPSVKPVPQFQGRVSITATTLRIGSAQLRDAGQYTVVVDPGATTGLAQNSRTATLNVFDAVTGVNLFVPSVAIETKNISLTCTFQTGTDVTFQWTKGGTTLAASSRITITGGSLVINPGERTDAGDYTCTVNNPVSARAATQTLTVNYGPDTPVVTKDTAKDCVGAGDVWAGKTITLTCTSTSLPQATFSWQFNGQAINSANTGVFSLQTSSTDQSGTYTCTARNSVTALTSEQPTDVVVTDVCLDVGEVVGVVIGSFILLILLIILIILIVRCVLVRRRRREASAVQKNDANPRPIPQNPAPIARRDAAAGPQPPPLYHADAEPRRAAQLYTVPIPGRNSDRRARDDGNNSSASRHNGIPLGNDPRHNSIRNANNPTLHNGFDNPAFSQNEVQTSAQQQQMQNPNIVIQTGSAQVSLNTLQRTAQQNNNGQIPTIHVNLNTYPGEQTQQQNIAEVSAHPVGSATVNEATQTPQTTRRAASTLRTPMLDRHRAILQAEPGQIPTGYTHYNRNNVVERNASSEFEMYNQQSESRDRSESSSSQAAPLRQLPWDTLRGTPAYPNTNQRRRDSDSTNYTTHPPIPQTRSRSRDRQEEPRERENRRPSREAQSHTQRSTSRDDMRGRRESRAPRQEARRDNSPPALPLMSQASPAGRPPAQQQPDTRALADPNHLQQAQVSQVRQVPQWNEMTAPHANQTTNKGPQANQVTNQSLQATRTANQMPQNQINQENRQTQAERQPTTRPQSQLTQEALQAHTERAQTFQNRRQQTQAALLHPGTQTQNRAPTPPPVIPLQQFQTLPKERTRPRDPRPPVNMPVAQRPHQTHHRQHATAPPNHHHHHHHHHTGHAQGPHRQPHTHTWQQQTQHRGRPR